MSFNQQTDFQEYSYEHTPLEGTTISHISKMTLGTSEVIGTIVTLKFGIGNLEGHLKNM
jgi:hypothetical protein